MNDETSRSISQDGNDSAADMLTAQINKQGVLEAAELYNQCMVSKAFI